MEDQDVKRSKDGVFVRLTGEQKRRLEDAARVMGVSLATWMRIQALAAAPELKN